MDRGRGFSKAIRFEATLAQPKRSGPDSGADDDRGGGGDGRGGG